MAARGYGGRVRNYYLGSPHWPRGVAMAQADNVDLEDLATLALGSPWHHHVAGEWAGSACAIEDIQAAGHPDAIASPASRPGC